MEHVLPQSLQLLSMLWKLNECHLWKRFIDENDMQEIDSNYVLRNIVIMFLQEYRGQVPNSIMQSSEFWIQWFELNGDEW